VKTASSRLRWRVGEPFGALVEEVGAGALFKVFGGDAGRVEPGVAEANEFAGGVGELKIPDAFCFGRCGSELSHPKRKDKDALRAGHPLWWLGREKTNARTTAGPSTPVGRSGRHVLQS